MKKTCERPQIPVGRAGNKLNFGDGFLYYKKMQYSDKLYLRCALLNKIGCKASYVILMNEDGSLQDDLRCVTPHNHPPNDLDVQTESFLNELKKAVETVPYLSTREIYDMVSAS